VEQRTRRRAPAAPAHALARGPPAGEISPEEAKLFQTSDRWVRRFIGFTERRSRREGEGTIDLAARAARQLFARTGRGPGDIDAIVVATVTPSYRHSPPDAALAAARARHSGVEGTGAARPQGADMSLACCSGCPP
jgi:3-oxoacyl-[acyl-carrier-protein] synthase-3